MSNGRLGLCFGVHNHQPIGNFDHVLAEATEHAYRPFLERVRDRSELKLTIHCTGSLLEWLRERAPTTFDLLGAVVARGQVELLTGGFYEPILAILPDHDKIGQIERLTEFLKGHFGVRPRGMWLAERVWEPQLPRALREAGVEYVLVDDSHFALAGFDPATLQGYYLTEDQGAGVAVFPISQRLRYLTPFGTVDDTLAYLETRRPPEGAQVLTVVDDGEKFGAWPGTYRHVYEDGWLDRFFDRVLATSWLSLTTFGDAFDQSSPSGRAYLPTASYREMSEWALPTPAARALADAKRRLEALPEGQNVAALLRGGFWRTFLFKYPEFADIYWKMLRLSAALQQELARHPDDPRLVAARTALWRGQANDAYWHGVFGGCYLPHLRRAVKQSLLECERLMADVTLAPALGWTRGDANGDGREEVLVRTDRLAVTINPELGGTITELGWLPAGLDLADVFTRRPELYHDQVGTKDEGGFEATLEYDELRRASLTDGLFDAGAPLDPVAPWTAARWVLGRERLVTRLEERGAALDVAMTGTPGVAPIIVDKRITVRGSSVDARYRLRARDGETLGGRWAVQWNLAMTAGAAPDRYLTLPDHPSLGSRGRAHVGSSVALIDEWIGVQASLTWSEGAELAWGPVETISVSEAGLERIYQGTALLLTWPLDGRGAETELVVGLTVAAR